MPILASVKLTVVLLALTAATVLVGAWCPQEAQQGREKIIEQFGADTAKILIDCGITDIFHSPWFLLLIGLLTVNMVACSMQRVFPKLRLLKQPLPFLKGKEIGKLPVNARLPSANDASILVYVEQWLRKRGFKIKRQDNCLVAEYGKIGRLAPTITHIGLLTLLLGVTVTSWCGFSGFKPVLAGGALSFEDSEHSKLWIGKLPRWYVRVDTTRREDHPSGDPKQWYTHLTVVSPDGTPLKEQEISVNNPLSYDGVDIYQSSWGLDHLLVSFNGKPRQLDLRQMGKTYAAFLPLDEGSILIFSVRGQKTPVRIFAKRADWDAPKLLAEMTENKPAQLGAVTLRCEQIVPATGLQYKCDPGLPITYVAFGFIIIGVMLAAIPHRHVWVCMAPPPSENFPPAAAGHYLYIGGRSLKAKVGFQRLLDGLIAQLKDELRINPGDDAEKSPKIDDVVSELGKEPAKDESLAFPSPVASGHSPATGEG